MKTITMFLALLIFSGALSAQSIERSTIAAAGEYYSVAGIQLSWTLGQPSPAETFIKPAMILTQGFQQADITTGVPAHTPGTFSLLLYPNPASGVFNLDLAAGVDGTVTFEVFDLSGKLIMHQGPFATDGGRWQHQQATPGLATGIYHCRVIFTKSDRSVMQQNLKLSVM